MRTHPVLAVLVVAATIGTVAVFGQQPVPGAPAAAAPAHLPRHADPKLDAASTIPAAAAWLVPPSAPVAACASGAMPAASAAAAGAPAFPRRVLPADTADSAPLRLPDAHATAVERGRYLAVAGDCAACHTRAGGAPYAGGRPIATPFGVVLSANLTPDETGLKNWSADQFWHALHDGVSADGSHLYPAFPYDYTAKMPRADVDALYAYLRTLAPVANRLDRDQLRFPFNIRATVALWNLLYLDRRTFRPDPAHDAQWNRGAYLVEGPAHCGACHTPRNALGGPKRGKDFQGGRFGDWVAPDLTPNPRTGLGGWKREELLAFLRTGRNRHASASGEMGLVVHDSTSRLADADLQAIAAYLADRPESPTVAVTPPDPGATQVGEAIFVDACSACHLQQGEGQPEAFPPLAHSASLQQADPTSVLHVILAGVRSQPTAAAPTPFTMPAFAWKLDDAQVAAVATYVRSQWGNAAPAVTAAQVAALRARLTSDAAYTGHAPPTPLARPGPNTLGTPGTDSRDNGTPRAGRAAPPDVATSAPALPASTASAPASASTAGQAASGA